MTAWDSDYENGDICYLAGGGIASVATEAETDPAEIWFRKSNDEGATWSTPVMVGTLTSGKMAQVHQKTNGALIVTNGIDSMWQSTDGGRSWTQL